MCTFWIFSVFLFFYLNKNLMSTNLKECIFMFLQIFCMIIFRFFQDFSDADFCIFFLFIKFIFYFIFSFISFCKTFKQFMWMWTFTIQTFAINFTWQRYSFFMSVVSLLIENVLCESCIRRLIKKIKIIK